MTTSAPPTLLEIRQLQNNVVYIYETRVQIINRATRAGFEISREDYQIMQEIKTILARAINNIVDEDLENLLELRGILERIMNNAEIIELPDATTVSSVDFLL